MQWHYGMRTTLDIADDILLMAKDVAQRKQKTAGQVISELARKGLTGGPASAVEPKATYGFRPLPEQGRIISNELINKLREGEKY